MYKFFLDYDRDNLDGIVVPEDFIFTKEQVIKAFENIDPCYGSSDDWTHYEDELEMNFLLEVDFGTLKDSSPTCISSMRNFIRIAS